jgi:hypothetical protein
VKKRKQFLKAIASQPEIMVTTMKTEVGSNSFFIFLFYGATVNLSLTGVFGVSIFRFGGATFKP